MPAQRARPGVEAAHRSIHPNIPGVPWWTALLIAITATAVGYGIDAGHKELTHVFAGCYIAGCVAAALAVRQEGLFTAIIQPPLILFCAVPGAYWLFHGGKIGRLKDLLINCGYPLIERFPLMLGTAGIVLLIGLVRWYFGMSHRATYATDTPDDAAGAASPAAHSLVRDIAAKLHSILRPETDNQANAEAPHARRGRTAGSAAGSASKTRRPTRSGGPTERTARSRPRRTRQPDDEQGPTGERPRRPSRRGSAPARDHEPAEPPRRARRRPRPQTDPDLRDQPPREALREPRPRRRPHDRAAARGSRFDDYDMYDPPGSPERNSQYDADDGHDRYEPAREPKRRRPANGVNPTHHPISQVRYREAAPRYDSRDGSRTESSAHYRPRSRAKGRSQRPQEESWEYDA